MLGQEIKKHMDKNGIKYSYIAARIGVSDQVFSAMLAGKRKITAEEYFRICAALHVERDTFAKVSA